MQHEQMLLLIKSSGIDVILAYEYKRRYVVSLQVGGRFQCDALDFTNQDFNAVTLQEAQDAIDASKADMLRASKTKSGNLSDSEEVKQAKKEKRKMAVKSEKKKEDETEKHLRQMRARGNRLAKSVKYV